MDDLQEQKTADLLNVGQFCYISSWTDDERESIPMWNMYASLDRGVRIRLRKNPFKVYHNSVNELSEIMRMSARSACSIVPSIIPLKEMFLKGFVSPQAMAENILHKVEYTDDKEQLYPKMVEIENDQLSLALGKLGKYKNTHWEFQREWRYILTFIPLALNQPLQKSYESFQIIANKIRLDKEKQPFPYYDMVIADEAFDEMQVILSPRISAGNRIFVESLLEKYNNRAELSDSTLLGLI